MNNIKRVEKELKSLVKHTNNIQKGEKKLRRLAKYLYFRYGKYINNISFKVNEDYYEFTIIFNKIGYDIKRQEIGNQIVFYDKIEYLNTIKFNKVIKFYIKSQIKGGNW